jgi:uncharacterized protein (TIGR02118 family)
MIRVSAMYPNAAGCRFDHAYYKDSHMPMVAKLMGPACLSWSVDKGLAGGAPGAPPAYVAMCHILCESVESFQASFVPHAPAIMADVPNYTNLMPILQVSEITAG